MLFVHSFFTFLGGGGVARDFCRFLNNNQFTLPRLFCRIQILWIATSTPEKYSKITSVNNYIHIQGWAPRSFPFRTFRSFKECNILFRSFFEFLATYGTQRTFRSFPFFRKERKERKVLLQKTQRSLAKNVKEHKERNVLLRRT